MFNDTYSEKLYNAQTIHGRCLTQITQISQMNADFYRSRFH
jgi:hypothetical protein